MPLPPPPDFSTNQSTDFVSTPRFFCRLQLVKPMIFLLSGRAGVDAIGCLSLVALPQMVGAVCSLVPNMTSLP